MNKIPKINSKSPKILIGDNFYGLGKKLSNTLNDFGFSTICRSNNFNILYNEIVNSKFYAVIFFTYNHSEKIYDFMEKIRLIDSDIKIISLIYTKPNDVQSNIIKKFSARYILMPTSFKSIGKSLFIELYNQNNTLNLPYINEFLFYNDFKVNMSGFNYISSAIEFCLNEPQLLSEIMLLYEKIAEIFNKTPQSIERSIRYYLSKHQDAIFKITNNTTPLCNSEFIYAITNILKK